MVCRGNCRNTKSSFFYLVLKVQSKNKADHAIRKSLDMLIVLARCGKKKPIDQSFFSVYLASSQTAQNTFTCCQACVYIRKLNFLKSR